MYQTFAESKIYTAVNGVYQSFGFRCFHRALLFIKHWVEKIQHHAAPLGSWRCRDVRRSAIAGSKNNIIPRN